MPRIKIFRRNNRSEDGSQRKFAPTPKVFTLDIDGKPTVSFKARTPREGTELLREGWFLDDLSKLTSEGQPLWDGASQLRVRPASEDEVDRYRNLAAEAEDENGDILLAFLVTLDDGRTEAR